MVLGIENHIDFWMTVELIVVADAVNQLSITPIFRLITKICLKTTLQN